MSTAEPLADADTLRVEILVNAGPGETRAAQIERGVLQDIHIQRDATASAVSNIYLGVVQRVLAGMQAAFVDIGLERAAFLQVSDMVRAEAGDDRDTPRIEKRLRAGDRILVQVTRDAMGTKGARLTTDLAIPSRFLVYMPHTPRIGVSARIESEEERSRLFDAVTDLKRALDLPGGFIVRTVADGAPAAALAADMRFLATVWADIQEQAQHVPGETLVYGDLPLAIRMLRDLLTPDVSAVIIDDARAWQEMIGFTRRFAPEFTDRLLLHDEATPLFAQYGIEDAIQRALQPKVPLKSGGFLIIEQTEAMVTVDVNTGGFVGTRSLEQTVLRTNLEAAQTVARQLRLRNLGGIIVIDFIDMVDADHKQQVLAQLAAALAADPAKTSIGQLSNLGLVEITRKRTRESLEHLLCAPCEACGGRGYVKTPETITFELFREITRRARLRPHDDAELLVLAPPDTIDQLLDSQADAFRQVCADAGVTVRLQAEALYGPEQFDVVVM
ncbi:Rne/Rng family ribonuclease [Salinisphaera hydrothermalis C41B8]|uniref:Rne/Rng family ribonuclease n=1 Tax=Salinisphaera hydrothermalis (strain C41B8) TaxID=1304275 RepID=A0A084IIG7_SALHC|nr:Rne/Rng family ribonuclease [Salinisphaera hydrothermalis]KEZ76501.1 Rne/Rng family ribonuclease [Salinisphaera hydrothermalis C41B8]